MLKHLKYTFFHKNLTILEEFTIFGRKIILIYICLYLVLKKQNITIITKKSEKILMCVGVFFFGKILFLTGVTIKFYQKSNFSPKNNLFSTFSRICFRNKLLPHKDKEVH